MLFSSTPVVVSASVTGAFVAVVVVAATSGLVVVGAVALCKIGREGCSVNVELVGDGDVKG